jgi:CHAT domain-containing protein
MEILKKQLTDARRSQPAARPDRNKSAILQDPPEMGEADIEEMLVELEAATSRPELSRFANRATAGMMMDSIYRLYGTLKASGRKSSEELDLQIMSFFLESNGPAYGYYRLHAFYDSDRPARAMEERYLQAYCQDERTFKYSCFTVLSQKALTHARQGQNAQRDQTNKSLDRALHAHTRLNSAIAQVRDSASDEKVRSKAALELRSLVAPASDIPKAERQPWEVDEMEAAMVMMREISATSYWLARAFGKDFTQIVMAVEEAAPARYQGDGWSASVLTGSFSASAELSDHATQLLLIRSIRAIAKGRDIGQRSDFDPLKLMEVNALYDNQEFGTARKLAAELRKLDAYKEPKSDSRTDPFKLLASCKAAQTFGFQASEQPGTTRAQYLLTRLELKLAARSHESIPRAKLAVAMEYEARGLFVDPDSDGIRPSELVVNWPEYSGALSSDKAVKKRTAQAVKCLLARPDVAARLGMEFINKTGKVRRTLISSTFAILSDSGLFEKNGASVADEDFVLLQAASLLQAQNGISATTARSVFEDKGTRDLVQRFEINQSRMSDQLADLGAGLGMDFRRAMQAMGPGLDVMGSMLNVMRKYPREFATYSDLRNQNITTLAEVQKVLGPGEASVLLTLFDEKLVAVVVTREQARMVASNVARNDLVQAIVQLRSSINLLATGGNALPQRYRVDIAWKLYQTLMRPLSAALSNAHTVYLVAGEDLASIPFQALVTSAPPAQKSVDFRTYRQLQWLGDRHAFVSLPSAHALLKAMSVQKAEGTGKVLGIGEAAVSGQIMVDLGLSPMPDTSRLLRKAGKPIDPPPLLHAAASFAGLEAASRGDDLRRPDMLLINSHTIGAGEGERYGTVEPAILLAPSTEQLGADFVDPPRVMSLKLSLRTILLLACQTAGGRSKDNAQPFAGLVNSFFFAGSDSVVATNLPVDPAVAEEFAVSFLHHVRDRGASSANAVQQAAAEVRCSANSLPCAAGNRFVWAHPAYWAQFTLVGSGR